MCGFVGYLDTRNEQQTEVMVEIARGMADRLRHRGPDDQGIWTDQQVGIALAHRRLSIIDLSKLGHQPMHSANEDWVLIYNGEIYNFLQLRADLGKFGHQFQGGSDTEVILAAFSEWGVTEAVSRFNGMFSFAAWQKSTQQLFLCRDRLGIKPLYYGWSNGILLFGSELKALRAHPAWRTEISRNALALYMRHCYVPTPYSIYEGIYKLPPGTLLTLSGRRLGQPPDFRPLPDARGSSPKSYWDAKKVMEQSPLQIPEDQILHDLESLLSDAVGLRMVADVPLGAFLSGGIDSSLVVALMQHQSSQAVKTFTIGFHEQAYNEAEHAAAVARHLNTDHFDLYVSAEQARNVIPLLAELYDEPFADSSQIPTFLVSKLARQHVTVSLSGDGGDELFFGYDRYRRALAHWMKREKLPAPMRSTLSSLARFIPASPRSDRLIRAGRMLRATDHESFYHQLISIHQNPTSLVLGSTEPTTVFTDVDRRLDAPMEIKMMFLDLCAYLPDDILTKVDRASMGVSLEARVPLLDHRVLEYIARIPMNFKMRDNQAKWALRQVLYRHVPKELIERPKMGFGIPVEQWITGPLLSWAEELLDPQQMKEEGFFNVAEISRLWSDFKEMPQRGSTLIWQLLMFQDWFRKTHSSAVEPATS